MERRRIGLIGAGNMATALVRGLLSSGVLGPEHVRASDPDAEKRKVLEAEFGVEVVQENEALLDWAEVLVLAVKPQILPRVLRPFGKKLDPSKLVISVAAGVACASIEALLAPEVAVIRAMPNTPALIQAGATGIAPGSSATEEQLQWAKSMFEAVGGVVVVDERQLDVVTGLSGSGPAYVMLFIEALADGAVRMGMPKGQALELATMTVLGSAKLLVETGQHPSLLRDQVTSPGGTTIAGLYALEQGGVRASIMGAVSAAATRARELSALG